MFKFKGLSSKEMDVHVTEIDNLIRKAPQRYEEIYIDGRDGAFFHPLGYSPIEVPLELTLMKPERIDEVLQWLNGTGWLEYNGRKTKAHIFSEVEPVRASTVRIIQVTIIRNPFWERVDDDWEEPWGVNLIENGWDNFKLYGSGRNYVENYTFEQDKMEVWNNYARFTDDGFVKVGYRWDLNQQIKLGKGKYVVRGKYRKGQMRTACGPSGKVFNVYFKTPKGEEWEVSEQEVYIEEDVEEKLYVLSGPNQQVEIDWIQITPVDNQHLVVEKTPLENGLTRIQTWGGNHPNKLVLSGVFTEKEKQYTFSSFMSDLSGTLRLNTSYHPTIAVGENEHVTMTSEGQGNAGIRVRVRTKGVDNNLDFIASDPIIVEGDKAPNWQATSDPAIYNEGTATSKPLIKLEKGKDRQCEFEVNGTYFKFHFNNDDHVILDCEEMEATYNGFNRNRHLTIGFEWPKLKPKENFVKRISGDAKILFKRKDRWL